MDNFLISKIDSSVIEYSESNTNQQLQNLKDIVLNSLDYFRTLYINLDDNIDNNLNKNFMENEHIILNKYKLVMTKGYELVIKINSMLEIIQITDTSQTNKYKYEECIHNLSPPANFLNIFNGIVEDEYKDLMEEILNESKIHQLEQSRNKDLLIEKINKLIKKKCIFSTNSSINIFNHYINQLVLQLCKIKLILKNTYISN